MGKKNVCGFKKFLDTLNELLVADWHYKHEDIVLLLQKISSVKSMRYLYDAIDCILNICHGMITIHLK